MPELKPDISLLEGLMIGDAISEHHGVRCYPAMNAETEEKYIYIKSAAFAGNIVIRFENMFAGKVDIRNGIPVTSKKDSDMHGIGIRSIENAASRYGGTVNVKADNKKRQFTLIVMLPAGM
jgi:signal transduction histidine kinase